MNPPSKPWYNSWPSHIECSITPERAEQNARFLEGIFRQGWIQRALLRNEQHPLINMWRSAGDQLAFLQLNTLAEDLRQLADVRGLGSLIADLKRRSGYIPAAHTVHVASLFSRAGNPVQKFFAPGKVTVPDFEAMLSGVRVPIKAKQLTTSEPARRFSAAAFALKERLAAAIFDEGRSFPEIQIIVGDPLSFPSVEEIIYGIETALLKYQVGVTVNARSDNVNIRLIPASIIGGMDQHRAIQVIAPRDDSEDARVEGILKKSQ